MTITDTASDRLDIPAALRVEQIPVADELNESFMAYAMSVITSRAIPDARDGLKPVQRRVLWSMSQMGIKASGSYRKSARVVGDTMGRYHPHGDAAIYDALVRLAQDFSLRLPLVAPQGNFGSLDDPPAASRYTECRLAEAAMLMLAEADENTVDYLPTYDGEGTEPSVLPAMFPNLLVNGAAGIAVGMATRVWCHNLAEVSKLVQLVVEKRIATKTGKRPEITLEEMMKVMPGPDFPGGGVLVADNELAEAYITGKGSVTLLARIKAERSTRTRLALIITELPYQVGPEQVVARVQKLLADNKLEGVTKIIDLSDTTGVRLRVELKPDGNPEKVAEALYRQTPLQTTIKANCLALVDGRPTTLTLRQLLDKFIDHRLEIIARRTKHRIAKAEARLHLVDGLIIAVSAIDEVVAIVRKAKDSDTARKQLSRKLKLSQLQAEQVLAMPIRRLTSLEQTKLKQEAQTLRRDLKEWKALLGSRRKQLETVRDETTEASSKLSTPRQTQIVKSPKAAVDLKVTGSVAASSAPAGPCQVTLSSSGQIGVENSATGRRSVFGRHDLLTSQAGSSAGDKLAAITKTGRTAVQSVDELPNAGSRARGEAANEVLGLPKSEQVVALIGSPGIPAVVVTSTGAVMRVEGEELYSTSSKPLAKMPPKAEIVAAFPAQAGMNVAFMTSKGRLGVVDAADIPRRRRASMGVAGIKLETKETVVAAGIVSPESSVACLTNKNRWCRVGLAKAKPNRRPPKGHQAMTLQTNETVVQAVFLSETSEASALIEDKERRDSTNPNPVSFTEPVTDLGSEPVTASDKIVLLAESRQI